LIKIRQRALRAAALLGVLAATGASMIAASVTASASSLTSARAAAAQVTPDITLPLTTAPAFPTDPAAIKQFGGLTEVEHTCEVIQNAVFVTAPGSGNSIKAVNCADVFVWEIGGTTGNEVYVQNEVFCQWVTGLNKGKTTACSGISEQVGAGSPQGTAALPAQPCGEILGHSPCTSGRTVHAGFAFSYHPGSMAVECTIWGESLRVSVILPIASHPTVSETVLPTPRVNVFSSTNALGYCLDT
jgi:hypothetical protein